MKQHHNALPEGHKVHWYVIKKVLGQGGFGITYLADDINLGREVAIKEYLPTDMALREADSSVQPVAGERGEMFSWGLDRFISEAQTLARFKHPNIVHVFSVFRENNTAYMVMEYELGRGLDEVLKQDNILPQNTLLTILIPLLDGLEQIHGMGFIHRDIKPANIYIREDGSPVLLDFGSARQSLGGHTGTLTAMVSPGFAPFEQYTSKGEKQGPWTDIYGLGASLYRAVTGRAPPNAMDRSEAIHNTSRDIFVPAAEIRPEGYSTVILDAIDRALAFRPEDRPQSIAIWRRYLSANSTVVTARSGEASETGTANTGNGIGREKSMPGPPSKPPGDDNPVSIRRWLIITAVLIFFVVVMGVGVNSRRSAPEAGIDGESGPILIDYSDLLKEEPDQTEENTGAAAMARLNDNPVQAVSTTDSPANRNAAKTDINTAGSSSDGNLSDMQTGDARPLELLQRRLQQNPTDPEARKELRTLISRYEQRVKDALKRRDFEEAEVAVRELLAVAPNNEKLKESLLQLRRLRQQQ